ncbi:16S rRNA (cytosine(1407)-C(5))-methyltransferase RsmF [Ferrimonas gelatinilytica]|uniref:Ribosomal RNA small subunit methyltransferase F n=1 Tax=Ferrimonas gelatinilytica TaxID=1255257 RepID=A0ABP9RWJ8_9GAMM
MVKFPKAFLDSIAAILPPQLELDDFIAISQTPLRRSIRVNTLKIGVEEFVQRMEGKGWHLEPIPWCDEGFWLNWDKPGAQLGNTPEHLAGLFYIQEASSMMPPNALFALAGQPQTVLDVASAPGSKTSQMAARMNNQGVLIANEYSSSRLKSLHANLQRLGIRNVALTHFDGKVFGPTLPERFDAILLDAPCSGEGTVRKDPQAMANWSFDAIEQIAAVQKTLIESAFTALKPGGTLVYSTCTLLAEENQAVCHWLRERHPELVEFISLGALFPGAERALTEEGFLHIWPQIYDSEGFFVAAIRKRGSMQAQAKPPKLKSFPFTPAPTRTVAELRHYLETQLGLSLPDEGQVMARDQELWWFPQALNDFIGKIRMNRLGIKIAQVHKHGFKIQHEAIMALPLTPTKCVELTDEQATTYLMGRDLPMDTPAGKGEVIVRWTGQPLGLAKWVGSKLKNGLPRELVRDQIVSV